ncbi:hypothetical protein GR138_04335 [Shinella kummerowiae]|jgi:hypothetical protein|uniref:Glycosyltransferase n=1 Tax=Shinella kummerowiae TaxID=417745 RepID=A0A6N8SAS7_9HYPH|nr:glycosyltransferase [Shinella kummerowiae]MXN44406.1 hypothetical protein [Shinella kummerowiae]
MQAGSEMPAAMGPAVRSDLRLETRAKSATRAGQPVQAANAADAAGRVLVYSRSQTGRRPAYLRVMEQLFDARKARLRDLFFSRSPVLFLMIEEAFVLYLAASLLRALTGGRTAGLLLRPMPVVMSRRPVERCKRLALQWLKRLPRCQTLTIVPFSVFPPFSSVASGWIYDFQLWDLTGDERDAVDTLRRERHPPEYGVVTAIGTQSRRKGFDLFADTYTRSCDLRRRFQFLACGKVAPGVADYAAAFCEAGGVAVDRAVSDCELLGAYAASDAVWCLYPPAGDHASGILGRAAQLGIPVVVRYGSLAHRLCIVENILHVATTADRVAERLADPLPPRDATRGRLMALRFARESEAALRAAFGWAG